MGSADDVNGNEDLLTNVLRRVPAKPLTKFKSVSTRWLSLISETRFSLLHAAYHKPRTSGLFLGSSRTIQKLDFVQLDNFQLGPHHFHFLSQPGITILHSCNGLFCYSKLVESKDRPIMEYYVCNATTRKSVKIPLMGLVYFSRRSRGTYRVANYLSKENIKYFNPENEPTMNVLGVYVTSDPQMSPHYRVVCVWLWDSLPFNDEIKIIVYRSVTRSWGETLGPFKVPYLVSFNPGIFWNDRLHWISKSHMVIFNFNEEKHTVLSLPLNSKRSEPIYFGDSNGRLHVVVNENSADTQLNVFEMERDYSEWVLKFSFHIEPIISLIPDIQIEYKPSAYSVIYIDRGENKGESYLLLGIDGKLMSYNIENKTLKNLSDLSLFNFQDCVGWAPFDHFKSFPFHETILEV